MLKTGDKRRSLFLKSICSDSGICIAFGKESKKIKQFFDGFNHFNYATKVKQISASGVNGNVYEIEYEREGYIAHTVIKQSKVKHADNLVYEYMVGKFINKASINFPCFIETYNAFIPGKIVQQQQTPMELLRNLVPINPNLSTYQLLQGSCIMGPYFSLLIQHMKSAKTLDQTIREGGIYFINHELLYIFAQVYIPLSYMRNIFTHYDLHSSNVLLYEPVQGSYIEYHYHLPNQIYSFKSRYIAKIIDYGRCYFKDTEINSLQIYEALCVIPACYPKCGYRYGYSMMNSRSAHLNPTHKNESADLRLVLHSLELYKNHIFQDLYSSITYSVDVPDTHKPFGTIENLTSGIMHTNTPQQYKINNITDITTYFMSMIKKEYHIRRNNQDYVNLQKLGDLHIYLDNNTPMRFIPATKDLDMSVVKDVPKNVPI